MFLDHASTTKIHRTFLNSINTWAEEFANPSSNHVAGLEARNFMKSYKERILKEVNDFYNTEFTHFILTSGATESINTVIHAFAKDDFTVVSDQIEHKATLESIKTHFKHVNNINLNNPSDFTIDTHTNKVLITLMTVNNETGSILSPERFLYPVQDEIVKIIPNAEIYTHCDNTQGFMKTQLDLHAYDMMSFSGHKIGTFKGIGGLFLNDRAYEIVKKHPLILGGNQQEGIRAGTENPLFIAALYQLILELHWEYKEKEKNISITNDIVKSELIRLANELNLKLHFNTLEGTETSKYIINFAFEGIEGESVLTMLNNDALATTSACNSETLESSYVLKALGVPSSIANCALRMSFNNDELSEVVYFIRNNFKDAIKKLAQVRVRKTK